MNQQLDRGEQLRVEVLDAPKPARVALPNFIDV
jgi:hypothetical protein